jgi:hypothetical protein
MPLRRMREESELLQSELQRECPDLRFLLIHAQSFLQHAEAAAEGQVYPDTSAEDRKMIEVFIRAQKD